MGSRGGGRGRGRFGGGGFRHAKQEPFVLYPDIELPAIDKDKFKDKNCPEVVKIRGRLQLDLEGLPYYLEETRGNEEDSLGLERFSDKVKKRRGTKRVSLENSGYLTLQPGYFPLELVQGAKRRVGRKVQWNPKRDLKKLDELAEREENFKDEDLKKGKGEDEDSEEDVEDELEQDDDYESDDYNKIESCDDDDDDYNRPEEDDDEETI